VTEAGRASVRSLAVTCAPIVLFMTEENAHPDNELFFTRKELARLLQVRPARIRRWERRGLIPRLAPAGTRLVLYPRSAVLAWLARVDANERARQAEKTPKPGKARP
jgi:hypothetical protein